MIDRYRNYQPVYYRKSRQKKPRRTFPWRLLVLAIIGVTVYKSYVHFTSNTSAQPKASTPKSTPKPKPIEATPISDTTWSTISTNVNTIIAANPDLNIGVSVIDSATSTKTNYGLQEPYAGASTTKVLTAAAFLHLVETGQYTLQSPLGGRTAQEHLRLMLNQSNNESWAALNSAVGYSELTEYAHNNGITSYEYIGNLMKPSDQALLLQKVFKHELVNDAHTKLMLSYMQHTNNEDMIPVVVPAGATFYHKYGQLENRLHDGAIIDYKKRPLIIVIYTKGEGNTFGSVYSSRTALIQSIAKTIIDTFYAGVRG